MFFSCGKTISEEFIYSDKLIYSKIDSLPFTGKIIRKEEGEIIFQMNCCSGYPCGEWKGYYDYPFKVEYSGEYLDKNMLSLNTFQILGTDTFAINYENDGNSIELKSVVIEIVRSQEWMSLENQGRKNYYWELASSIYSDLNNKLEFRYLTLHFVDGFYLPSESFHINFRNTGIELVWN